MADKRIAARKNGDDYQSYIFWSYAIQTMSPNNLVKEVIFEDGSSAPFDDIVVKYHDRISGKENKYDRDYIQCKFKVGRNDHLKWENLIDPKYYKNRESFLYRAYGFYKKQEDDHFRLILYTPVSFDRGDVLGSFLESIENSFDVDKMFSKTDRKTREMIQKIKAHIGIEEDILKKFLSSIRINQGETMDRVKKDLKNKCDVLNISYTLSVDSDIWPQLITKYNAQGNSRIDKERMKNICAAEKLFVQERSRIALIGIDTMDERIKTLRYLGDACLDLAEFFSDRKLKEGCTWDDIIQRCKIFIDQHITFGKKYELAMSSIYSVSYLMGKLVGFKKGDVSLINRDGVWIKGDKAYVSPIDCMVSVINEEVEHGDGITLCICIAQTSIIDDVKRYCSDDEPTLSIEYCSDTIDSDSVWGFAENINKEVIAFLDNHPSKPIRLFYRGPAELMFIIGQYSNEWGPCQIYDFDFAADNRQNKKYFEGVLY